MPKNAAEPLSGDAGSIHEPGQSAEHTLRRKLMRGVGVMLLCIVLLAAVVVERFAGDYGTACRDLSDIRRFRLILDAANGVSAERGPANSVMAEEPSRSSPLWHRLAAMRDADDGALARVAEAAQDEASPAVGDALRGVVSNLASARREVDGIAAMPAGERSVEAVRHAIHGMFAVSDDLSRVRNESAARLLDRNQGLTAPLLVAEMLGDLRDHAGRIASDIIASVATHRPIPEADLIASGRTRGRLDEIWSLVVDRAGLYVDDPQVAAERIAVDALFFGEGLTLVDHVAEQGRNAGLYDLTASAFTARFVPTLAPIERLRMAFLNAWLDRASAARDHALAMLLAVSGCLVVVLSMLLGLVIDVQRHIFRPLLTASEEIIALAEDRGTEVRRGWQARGEMRRLFDAIEMLRAKMQERAALTETLGRLADTDGLTGLLNRRALDRAARRGLSSNGEVDSLILIDLDHFKAINDRYGHQAGDEALRRCATLLLAACPPEFTVARIGGEEFAVLMPATGLSAAIDLANHVCATLRTSEVSIDRETVIRLTASFGVGALPDAPDRWANLIARADAALYRAKTQGRDRVCWDGRGTDRLDAGEFADLCPSG